jgi:rhodanese-related sulfurtransferase
MTEDLLVYSKNNVDSIEFLEKLLNQTYSDLYYLEGGINAWKLAGYPVET